MKTKRLKLAAVLTVIFGSVLSIGHDGRQMADTFRAWLPYPVNYMQRVESLQGWTAEEGDGLNCSGFISNAHSVPFRTSYQFFANAFGDLLLISESSDVRTINEANLLPGDVAAFAGPTWHAKKGVHVAIYIGKGIWSDGDGRRGNVAKYRLSEKPDSDLWFTGHVRLYRWKTEPKFSLTLAASTLGKDNRS